MNKLFRDMKFKTIDPILQYKGRGIINMAEFAPIFVFKYFKLTIETLKELLNKQKL